MRRVPLRAVPPPDHSHEDGWREWHSPLFGRCACCSMPGRLIRHHVISERHVREAGGEPWDVRNALELGAWCGCHRRHHQAAERLPASILPADAIQYAVDLLGAGAADLYFDRYYAAR